MPIDDDSIREELERQYNICLNITTSIENDIEIGKINDKTVKTLKANNELLLNINNVFNSLKQGEKDKLSVKDSLEYIKNQIKEQVKKDDSDS